MERSISTSGPVDVVDVTADVEDAVPGHLDAGTCTVFVPHTTAGVVVNEAEGRLLDDVERALESWVPSTGDYRHDEIDDNAAAHLRSILLGESVTVPVEDGSLALGTWQSVLLVEGDGPRTRRFRIVVSEALDGPSG